MAKNIIKRVHKSREDKEMRKKVFLRCILALTILCLAGVFVASNALCQVRPPFTTNLIYPTTVYISLGNAEGLPGGTVSVPITLYAGGQYVGALAVDIGFDNTLLLTPEAEINPAIGEGTETDRLLISNPVGTGLFRIGLIPNYNNPASLDASIPDGVVATVTFVISAKVQQGAQIILENSPSSSTPSGRALPTTGRDGMVTIVSITADRDQDGYTVGAGDCNDSDASVYPGAQEIYDGLDNDCDGFTDEGLGTPPKGLQDVSEFIEPVIGEPVTEQGMVTYQVRLFNASERSLYPPVIAVVYANKPVLNPDGHWIDDAPYFDYTKALPALVFKPNVTTGAKSWTFQANAPSEIKFRIKVFARTTPIGWVPLLGDLQVKPLQIQVKNLTLRDYRFAANTPGLIERESQEGDETYQQLAIPRGRIFGEIGKPGLPGFTRLFAVPIGARVRVTVTEGTGQVFEDYLIEPVQPQPEDNKEFVQPPFTINREFYQQDLTYPDSLYSIRYDWIRGMKVAVIDFHTARYNPAKRRLTYYPELDFDVTFEGGEDEVLPLAKRSRFFEESYALAISNYEIVKVDISEFFPGPFFLHYDLLIITPDDFKTQADELAEWKTDKGFSTRVVTLDTIEEAEGGTTADDIRAYIHDFYDDHNISYVLLMGDAEFIPPHYVTPHPTGHGGTLMGTDLYYAEMDYAGYFPDLAVGRIPVDTVGEAQTVVDKIIGYEDNPPWEGSFYERILCGAYFQDDDNNGQADREFAQTLEEIRDFYDSEGFSTLPREYTTNSTDPRWWRDGTAIPAELRKPGFPWDGSAGGIVDEINAGSFLAVHRDHGSRSGWSHPSFYEGDLSDLTNGELLPVVLSINCQTGWFDNETDDGTLGTGLTDECFAEEFLKMSGGGAVGVIAATRNSPSYPNNDLTQGFIDCMWPGMVPGFPTAADEEASELSGSRRLGDALNYAKFYVSTLWAGVSECQRPFEIYNCLGDPTMELWTANPHPIFHLRHFEALRLYRDIFVLPIEGDNILVSLIQENETIAQGISRGGQVVLKLSEPLSYAEDTYISTVAGNQLTQVQKVTFVLDVTIEDIKVCNITSASASISWVTDSSTPGYIHYSADPAFAAYETAYDVRGEDTISTTHYVTLGNLAEKTTYYFEVDLGGQTDNNGGSYYTFQTAAAGMGAPKNIYGTAYLEDGNTPAEGAIAYATVGNSLCLSALVSPDGYWIIELSDLKDPNGRKMAYAPGDILNLSVNGGPEGTGSDSLALTSENPQDCGSITLSSFESYTMNFATGFNLMALPLYPLVDDGGSPIDLKAKGLIAVIPGCKQIFGWNANTQSWSSVLNTGNKIIGTDFPIEPDKGYFVQVSAPTPYTFNGYAIPAPIDLTLKAGFNLSHIYQSPSTTHTSYSLINAIPGCRQVFGWNISTQSWVSALKVGSMVIGTNFTIDFYKGYFVQTQAEITWP